MSIVQTFNKLAQEFLEKEVEEFELDLAVNGNKYSNSIEDFVEVFGHKNANKFHHLEFLADSLDRERDKYRESIRVEKYDLIFNELDEFLNNNSIKIDKGSSKYQLLARHFVEAKSEAITHKINITEGKSFEYSLPESTKGRKVQSTVSANCFQKIESLSWDRVTLNILSNEMIEIKTKDCNGRYTYPELGFKDARRGDAPIKIWGVLLVFGNQSGSIDWNTCDRIKDTKQLKKDVQRIGNKLKKFMGINSSPFKMYHKSRGYETKFRFSDSRHN